MDLLDFFFFFKTGRTYIGLEQRQTFFYNKHEFKALYMYLRQVSGRGHRTQDPFGSTFNALPLSYPQARTCLILFHCLAF